MRKSAKSLILRTVIATVFMTVFLSVMKVSAVNIVPTDVKEPSADCVFLGIKGEYIDDIDNALKRINEIRLEACKEGIVSPSTGKPLTVADYVPIKWSSDLEFIARIRAAEACLAISHDRLNGKETFSVNGPDGYSSCGEILAWNWSENMVSGIEQWYDEKSDWINKTPGAVTGHYTQMIDPSHIYVGIATFCSGSGKYFNTTAGEFLSEFDIDYDLYDDISMIQYPDESRGTFLGECIQTVEIKKDYLSGKYKLSGKDSIKAGEKTSLKLTTSVSLTDHFGNKTTSHGLLVLDPMEFSSSNSAVLTVDANGNVFANRCGEAVITVKTSTGSFYSKKISVEHTYSQKRTVEKAATLSENGKASYECKYCGKRKGAIGIARIKKISLSKKVYTYNGKDKRPKVEVVDSSGKKISSDNYCVTYSKNKKVGKATVTVTFKGKYSGTVKRSFKIVPKNTSISRIEVASKGFKVKWKKQPRQTDGYEIQYSTSESFKKGSSGSIKIKNAKKLSKTVKNLKVNTKYYIRIRTYKKVNKTTYYSAWSKVKAVKVRK